jgi:hypothetical protein
VPPNNINFLSEKLKPTFTLVEAMENRTFCHDNKNFEIRISVIENRYCVRIFLNNQQVSPEYSATIEVGQDYFSLHRKNLVDELCKIAESDIKRGQYFTA